MKETELFLETLNGLMNYWLEHGGLDEFTNEKDKELAKEKMCGLIFSILCCLDGVGGDYIGKNVKVVVNGKTINPPTIELHDLWSQIEH